MSKKAGLIIGFFLAFILFVLGGRNLLAGADIKIRFMEGIKEGTGEPAKIVTSSYLQPTITASIQAEEDLDKEQSQIKKIFNLSDVKLVTEADLKWPSKESDKVFHILQLDSKEYLILVSRIQAISKRQFHVEVYEQTNGDKKNLLDTEVSLPTKNTAVFGFEDAQGKPYFLSLQIPQVGVVGGVVGGVIGGVLGGVKGGVEGGVQGRLASSPEKIAEFEKGAMRCVGEIKPPRLLKKVDPVYPEEASKARVEGVVILGIRTDVSGKVKDAIIYRSIPLLDMAAIDAVRQWVYEPLIIEGEPKEALCTVTVRFQLNKEGGKAASIISPKIIKKVDPVYPEEARKNGIEGIVILEARTDEKGNVVDVRVLKPVLELNQAAIDALKQWKYEPVIIDGKPVGVVFTVTVKFSLK